MKRLTWLAIAGLCLALALPGPAHATTPAAQVKELNFVFLHGAGGDCCNLQLLADTITQRLPAYAARYEETKPAFKVSSSFLLRCYPNNVDIETWANNIVDSIREHFNSKNLVLVGHSFGGKAALYAVAHNTGDIADQVEAVVTINSPVKNMSRYYLPTGIQYWEARWLVPSEDQGVLDSAINYDSTEDGKWVGANRHWLALISAEAAPISPQFDTGGIDPLPRDMDDGIIPISAQYSEGADVVYYGEHGHGDFYTDEAVTGLMAEQILRYIFGGSIECSVFARGGIFEHTAGWLPIANRWQDTVGEIPASGGTIEHTNESHLKWQEWEDIVGECPAGDERSSFYASRTSLPVLTGLAEARWVEPDDPEDCRLYLRTRAAPGTTVRVGWSIFQRGLLPAGTNRDHYEVEIFTGTPFTQVEQVLWLSEDPRDVRLQIQSNAEGPFRWFKAEWRTYYKETRQINIIDHIPGENQPEATPAG